MNCNCKTTGCTCGISDTIGTLYGWPYSYYQTWQQPCMGWECPVCHVGVAPSQVSCPRCTPSTTTTDTLTVPMTTTTTTVMTTPRSCASCDHYRVDDDTQTSFCMNADERLRLNVIHHPEIESCVKWSSMLDCQ